MPSRGDIAPEEDLAIDAIPIANDIPRRPLPAVCLSQLTGNPFGARMRSHTKPQNFAAAMPQDQNPYSSRNESLIGRRSTDFAGASQPFGFT